LRRQASGSVAGRWTFRAYLFVIASGIALLAWETWGQQSEPASPAAAADPTRQELTVPLTRGDFTILRFSSKKPSTKAIILFGSGDGGWRDDFEEKVARGLQEQGFDVISFDCAAYSKTDYDLPTLQADFARIAQAAEAPFGGHPPPLIIGGYSMGAEQAVAVAGGPNPPPGIAGLLLISPTSRGRYGLRGVDKMDIPPSGPGTFGLADFAQKLETLRVAQWHGGWDPTDSVAWLDQLRAPYQKLVYPNAWHDFESACPDFLTKLGESATWVASPPGIPLANTPASNSVPEKAAN
jgi:hypothetical protein